MYMLESESFIISSLFITFRRLIFERLNTEMVIMTNIIIRKEREKTYSYLIERATRPRGTPNVWYFYRYS